jgi:hypothetical protein
MAMSVRAAVVSSSVVIELVKVFVVVNEKSGERLCLVSDHLYNHGCPSQKDVRESKPRKSRAQSSELGDVTRL